jgi:hypothetical protein
MLHEESRTHRAINSLSTEVVDGEKMKYFCKRGLCRQVAVLRMGPVQT